MTEKAILMKLFKMKQNEVKRFCKKKLRDNGYATISADGYLYAKGTLPVVVCAHMDTVHGVPTKVRESDGVYTSPTGLGADDRAGIFAILELLSRGYKPTVVFLEDEEIGCIGASKFVNSDLKLNEKFIIEFDRRGENDAVYYEGINYVFEDYIESFGFTRAYGSYSDIAVIAPQYNLAAVNLSVGYYFEHSSHEILVYDEMMKTIDKVNDMFDNLPSVKYTYYTKEYLDSIKKTKYRSSHNRLAPAWVDDYDNWNDWDSYKSSKDNDKERWEEIYEDYCNKHQMEIEYESDPKEITLEDCYIKTIDGKFINVGYDSGYVINYNDDIFDPMGRHMKGAIAVDNNCDYITYDDMIEDNWYKIYNV